MNNDLKVLQSIFSSPSFSRFMWKGTITLLIHHRYGRKNKLVWRISSAVLVPPRIWNLVEFISSEDFIKLIYLCLDFQFPISFYSVQIPHIRLWIRHNFYLWWFFMSTWVISTEIQHRIWAMVQIFITTPCGSWHHRDLFSVKSSNIVTYHQTSF